MLLFAFEIAAALLILGFVGRLFMLGLSLMISIVFREEKKLAPATLPAAPSVTLSNRGSSRDLWTAWHPGDGRIDPPADPPEVVERRNRANQEFLARRYKEAQSKGLGVLPPFLRKNLPPGLRDLPLVIGAPHQSQGSTSGSAIE